MWKRPLLEILSLQLEEFILPIFNIWFLLLYQACLVLAYTRLGLEPFAFISLQDEPLISSLGGQRDPVVTQNWGEDQGSKNFSDVLRQFFYFHMHASPFSVIPGALSSQTFMVYTNWMVSYWYLPTIICMSDFHFPFLNPPHSVSPCRINLFTSTYNYFSGVLEGSRDKDKDLLCRVKRHVYFQTSCM